MLNNDQLFIKINEIRARIEALVTVLYSRGITQEKSMFDIDRELAFLREEMNQTIRTVSLTCTSCGKINYVKDWILIKISTQREVETIGCPKCRAKCDLTMKGSESAHDVLAAGYPPLVSLFRQEERD